MFFGNPELLEKHLHNDMNILIKNVKLREDNHLTTLQYNKNLLIQQRQLDSIAFLNEELIKHNSFLESILEIHETTEEEEKQLMNKYEYVSTSQESIIKLMSRVISRIIEICQASVEKIKFLDQSIVQKEYQMKSLMMKILNEKPKLDIYLLIDVVISYVQAKSIEEIHKLRKIIAILEKGDIPKLESFYSQKKAQFTKINLSSEKRQSKLSIEKIKDKEKLEKYREDIKKADKMKKKKNKIANKMITGLYSTMELSRKEFFEDMIFTNPEEKKKKLFEEIFSRNKFNHEQILTFEAKRDQYEQKVKEFKLKMEKQSQKISQALKKIQEMPQEKEEEIMSEQIMIFRKKTQVKSEPPQSFSDEDEKLMPEKDNKYIFRKRQKKFPPKAPTPKFIKENAISSMKSTQQGFQHIKFDMRNQQIFTRSNRAKLPQINGRSSLEGRYQNRKSCPKEQKRINIVKNVDIGVFNSGARKMSPVDKQYSNNKTTKAKQTTNQGFCALNIMEYSFYSRNRGHKWNQTKTNFIF